MKPDNLNEILAAFAENLEYLQGLLCGDISYERYTTEHKKVYDEAAAQIIQAMELIINGTEILGPLHPQTQLYKEALLEAIRGLA